MTTINNFLHSLFGPFGSHENSNAIAIDHTGLVRILYYKARKHNFEKKLPFYVLQILLKDNDIDILYSSIDVSGFSIHNKDYGGTVGYLRISSCYGKGYLVDRCRKYLYMRDYCEIPIDSVFRYPSVVFLHSQNIHEITDLLHNFNVKNKKKEEEGKVKGIFNLC